MFLNTSLIYKVIDTFISHYKQFIEATFVTLSLSFLSVLFAVFLGIFICVGNLSKYKILQVLTRAYIEIIRGIPLLLQLYIIYVLTPRGFSTFTTCLVAIVINSSAYVCEIFRGGINSVYKGQSEASRSLGLSKNQTLIKIVLPQAVKNIIPSLCNEFITLIKETSLASVFFLGELMTLRNEISGVTYDALAGLIVIGIIYFTITFSLSKAVKKIEVKLAK